MWRMLRVAAAAKTGSKPRVEVRRIPNARTRFDPEGTVAFDKEAEPGDVIPLGDRYSAKVQDVGPGGITFVVRER